MSKHYPGIFVMNRNDADIFCWEYAEGKHNMNVALISIVCSDDKADKVMIDLYKKYNLAKYNDEFNIIKFSFYNFDDIEAPIDGLCEFRNEDAVRMAKFIKKNFNKVDKFIVTCDAGYSRSAGIGAAISKYFYNNDMEYFNSNGKYCPNMLCYKKLLNELVGEE